MTDTQDRKMIGPRRTFAIFAILKRTSGGQTHFHFFLVQSSRLILISGVKFSFSLLNFVIHIVVLFSVMHVY